ncbi:prepilin-type N-terminal cleavage/methylation domain-containing protein [Proteiniborus ethanoligenes]|uniref:Prepilin-type N-terminal cleavage/methylation domain-containing protein n=2 Tax=Proteiniborus ethanoligenes TaxID=415015 RepID=A0A1H3K6W9_9FIRM|nr:prepilin-type N-terminal cleavage/methylation domain-containing protein [Proteiniborus ethanoligenes]
MRPNSIRLNNGFTLIEILITLSLAGIVISIVLSLLITNIRMFHKTDKDIELQQQGQFIIGFLEEKILESDKIVYLENMDNELKHDTNEKLNVKKIIFKNSPSAKDQGYIFYLSKDLNANTYNLKYGKGLSGAATVEVGNYIEKIQIEPIPLNSKYTEAKGITIILYFNIDEQKKSFTTQLCFRNSQRRY